MATCLLKGVRLLIFLFFIFLIFFSFFFLLLCIRKSNSLFFKREGALLLFKGLRLLFLPNIPGPTFIQGGTSILNSRVHTT